MKVDLIASTQIDVEKIHPIMSIVKNWVDTGPDLLAEFAGRACYQSFDRPNPKTARTDDYLSNILAQGHESVLEHASATFYVTGVSRALTHELIRHRHLSYSELSQRFVNVEDTEFVKPPAYSTSNDEMVSDLEEHTRGVYRELVTRYERQGLTRKQAREAARAVMPNATETRIVVTGNMRAWRDVLKRRWHVAADAEIREFASEVLRQLKLIAPGQFQDFPAKLFGSEEAE